MSCVVMSTLNALRQVFFYVGLFGTAGGRKGGSVLKQGHLCQAIIRRRNITAESV